MSTETVQKQADAMGAQRKREAAREQAEYDIARVCDYAVECSESGRVKTARLYRDDNTLAAEFNCLSWKSCVGAARGWAQVNE